MGLFLKLFQVECIDSFASFGGTTCLPSQGFFIDFFLVLEGGKKIKVRFWCWCFHATKLFLCSGKGVSKSCSEKNDLRLLNTLVIRVLVKTRWPRKNDLDDQLVVSMPATGQGEIHCQAEVFLMFLGKSLGRLFGL